MTHTTFKNFNYEPVEPFMNDLKEKLLLLRNTIDSYNQITGAVLGKSQYEKHIVYMQETVNAADKMLLAEMKQLLDWFATPEVNFGFYKAIRNMSSPNFGVEEDEPEDSRHNFVYRG